MNLPTNGHFHLAARGAYTGIFLFSLMLVGAYFQKQEKIVVTNVQAATPILSSVLINPVELEAKAAIVYDARTSRILFEKNANQSLPLASLTKIMTAEAILSVASEDTSVTITQEDLASEGDSGLVLGDTWSLKNLLTFGLVASSNDAMTAAASSAGTDTVVSIMNSKALSLGLSDMRFSNPTGLDVSTSVAGAYGSARDMAILVSQFLKEHQDLFGNTVSAGTSVEGGGHEFEASPTAEPLLDIPGLIGAKTGYTDLAGGNLVAAFDIEVGHPVIVVVLGSSRDGRFSDMRALIDATRASLAK